MLYVRVGVLLTRGQNLHDRIISIRGEAWVHNTSLTPQLCIEVRVPIQDKERSYTSVSILPLSGILIFNFEIVPPVLNEVRYVLYISI
jgi:hypothetical protein